MRLSVSLLMAHVMNAHAAFLFLAPSEMPKPWLLEPGNWPAGPAGLRPSRGAPRARPPGGEGRAEGGPFDCREGGGGARHEGLGAEVGRRLVPVAHELVERRHPARPDPAAGVDEGHVEEVPRAAFGRQ